jgi:hypothetical protein
MQHEEGGVMMRYTKLTLVFFALLILFAMLCLAVSPAAAQTVVNAMRTKEIPAIDGQADRAWNRVKRVKIDIPGEFTVNAKFAYTDTHIYLLFEWPDKDESLNRMYVFSGGTWKTERGNEDRFNLFWSINNSIAEFDKQGCQIACHKKKGEDEGSMYTNGPNERGDLWHWKAQRTNPLGYADDQYVTNAPETTGDETTGRRADASSAGGYADNWDAGKNRPKYTVAQGKGGPVLVQAKATPVGDKTRFADGMRLPREVLEKPEGSRGDVAASGKWAKKKWTLELARKLVTGHDDDVQFEDLSKTYYFGISIHDNSGGSTHVTSKVVELHFK